MSTRNYVDNAPTTAVSGAINSAVTSITLASLAGYPASFPYTGTLGFGTAVAELVLVTGAAGPVATVVRNYDGQGAFSHPDGETFDHVAAAIDYREANLHVNASTAVHGLAGAVVGTTDVQSLSNKTLTSPTINSPTTSNATNTGDAGHSALVGKATTAGGKTLSLQNSSAVEKVFADDAGNATFSGTVTAAGVTVTGGGFTPTGAITPYAGLATPGGWLSCDGTAVSRTTYAALYAALCKSEKIGSLASTGSLNNWTGTLTVASSAGWSVGDRVTGPGINLGLDATANVIATIPDATHITFHSGAVGSPYSTTTTQTYVVAPFGNGDGSTTFNVPDLRGKFVMGANSTNIPASTGGATTHTHPLSASGQAQVTLTTGGSKINRVGTAAWTSNQEVAATPNAGGNSFSTAAALTGDTDSASTLPPYVGVSYIVKT